MHTQFTPFPYLETPRLTLRPVTPGDVDEMFLLRSDETVLKYIDMPPAASPEEALAVIHKINGLERENQAVTWGIVPRGGDKMIGTICFWNLVPERDQADVGYVLYPEYHGQGIMQEALAAILQYGCDVMQLKTVEAHTHNQNVASIRLLERNGFSRTREADGDFVIFQRHTRATEPSVMPETGFL